MTSLSKAPSNHCDAAARIWPDFSIPLPRSMSRNLFSLRYVDNRLCISERRLEQLPGVRLFLNSRFYEGDIILEDEPAFDFVGFFLDLHNRRIHHNRACQARDLPSTFIPHPQNQSSSVACWQEPTPSRSVLISRHKHSRISGFCGTSPRSVVSQYIPLHSRQSSGTYREALPCSAPSKRTVIRAFHASHVHCLLHEPMGIFRSCSWLKVTAWLQALLGTLQILPKALPLGENS